MKRLLAIVVCAFTPIAFAVAVSTAAESQELDSFSVLAGSAISNTGPTTISGNVGLSPGLGPAITGFPPGLIAGTIYTGSDDSNTVAENAQIALTTLFNNLQAEPATATLTGQTLGADVGQLTPGVYFYASVAQLTGQLTLNAQGNPNAIFVIQVGSTLTTASASSVLLINGAQGKNVYWVVGSSATLGTGTTFVGQILALTSITLTTGVTINCGAALAQNGAVTLDTNTISTFCAFTQFGTVVGPTSTPNQQAVADALDKYVTDGGTLPTEFQGLLDLSPAEMQAAFDQLSGETATGIAPTGMQAMNSFISIIFDTAFDEGPGGPVPAKAKQPYTVKALGYGPVDSPTSASAAFDAIERGTPGASRYDVWAAGYGGQYNTNGTDGGHDRFANAFGFATGFGVRLTPDTKIGLAIGAGGTNFSLSDALGGGSSDMVQTAVYSRTNFDAAYVATALAYAWHGVTTDRYVNIAGTDHLTADYSAQNVAGKIEAGYTIGAFTPFAAVGMQAFYTPAYSEHVVSGSSVAALDYDAKTTTATRTELGARFAETIALPNGMTLRLHSRAAWAHDFWSDTQMTAHFQSLPGSSFTVEGVKPASDSLLVGTGAQIGLANGFSVATLFDGEFAEGTQKYQGSLRLGYAW